MSKGTGEDEEDGGGGGEEEAALNPLVRYIALFVRSWATDFWLLDSD